MQQRLHLMGFVTVIGQCVACKTPITFNPLKVPSILVQGKREPLCQGCFNQWNMIHRTSKNLEPVVLDPDAYEPCAEAEL